MHYLLNKFADSATELGSARNRPVSRYVLSRVNTAHLVRDGRLPPASLPAREQLLQSSRRPANTVNKLDFFFPPLEARKKSRGLLSAIND